MAEEINGYAYNTLNMMHTEQLYKVTRQFNDFDINLQGHVMYLLCIDTVSESLPSYVMIDITLLANKLHMNEFCTYQNLSKFISQHCKSLQNIDIAEEVFVDFCKSNKLCLSYVDDEHLDMIQLWYLDKDSNNDDTTNVIDGFGNVVPIESTIID